MSDIIAIKLHDQMSQALNMSAVQKALGTTPQTLQNQFPIDKTVALDLKNLQTNLCTAWIGQKKTYDLMPHT